MKKDYYDHKTDPVDFVSHCLNCEKEVRMVKDSLEGQRVYCFDCSHLALKALK